MREREKRLQRTESMEADDELWKGTSKRKRKCALGLAAVLILSYVTPDK